MLEPALHQDCPGIRYSCPFPASGIAIFTTDGYLHPMQISCCTANSPCLTSMVVDTV